MPGFFTKLPSLTEALSAGPCIILIILVAGWISGYLKLEKGIKTNYTRKLFHVLIFSLAWYLHAAWGVEAVNLLGILMGAYIVLILILGEGWRFYEGLAREEDRPHRSIFIIVPYLTTAIGGILSNICFSDVAAVGYLVNGWGDAAGEPAGVRFGKRRYRVPSITGIAATRSLEGSAAVFLVGSIAAFAALFSMDFGELGWSFPLTAAISLLVGIISAAVEAFSPHGMDNLTVQLAASGTAWVSVRVLSGNL